VVPVASFATDDDHWVVDLGEVRVTVERDDTAVQLVADDRAVGPVETNDTLRLSPAGSVSVAVVAASASPFGD
jgi:NAD+ kinase